MGAVSTILDFPQRRDSAPTLVLVDLHDTGQAPDIHPRDLEAAIAQCRAALDCARQHDMPVAFVRHMSPSLCFLSTTAYPAWLGNIKPCRSDMVFERAMPSCYASSEFAQMARLSSGLVLAGLFGETSCLATLMEGYGRSHFFTYLADASVSRGHGGVMAAEMHRSVVEIAGLYSDVSSTAAWAHRMSRKIGATG